MQVCFYGACREVTGSNIFIEAQDTKILFDCGLFQGFKTAEERNFAPFPYLASEINCIIVCHAHLDHVGRLPKLYKEGFRGKIFATAPTRDLAHLVLEDTEKLMREEAERDGGPVLYTREHVEGVMGLFSEVSYDKRVQIAHDLSITLKNAGHILGSATCLLETDGKKLVYTSDLGNTPSVLLKGTEDVSEADYVICESTYGGRVHENVNRRKEKLAEVINWTISQNGVLMIPTFAIERTQELLHDIDDFCSVSGCEKPTFYLDSPLAQKVTQVFGKYPDFLNSTLRNEHKDNDFFGLDRVHITSTVDESKQIENAPNPKVIIAGSGMMNGGRILHHAIAYLPEEKNMLLIVGYQAQGTLGRRLFEGEASVKIFGKAVNVAARVKSIGSYSAHADMPQIIGWISKIKEVKKVFLVHGETDQSTILSTELRKELNVEVLIPQQGESYEL